MEDAEVSMKFVTKKLLDPIFNSWSEHKNAEEQKRQFDYDELKKDLEAEQVKKKNAEVFME